MQHDDLVPRFAPVVPITETARSPADTIRVPPAAFGRAWISMVPTLTIKAATAPDISLEG
ncbi:hypothetical protein CFR75_11880 [Komagataeibacter xylinus]|uniref:Uncharacterized protein n=1 Tax=Komagataeibacter xylinus TaxID=28448 RepID=A0A318PGY1_KOMXY|nr:hypothetical protein CXP35_07010 [Komagataeibacter xylinus]PYD56254.1 hypothetical protein CFR75_11880 [Komagataeibacter xylinus]